VVSLYSTLPRMGLWLHGRAGAVTDHSPEAEQLGRRAARRQTAISAMVPFQLLAAFAPTAGTGWDRRPPQDREAILEFLQTIVLPEFPHAVIYLIWTNLSAHKNALRLWSRTRSA